MKILFHTSSLWMATMQNCNMIAGLIMTIKNIRRLKTNHFLYNTTSSDIESESFA